MTPFEKFRISNFFYVICLLANCVIFSGLFSLFFSHKHTLEYSYKKTLADATDLAQRIILRYTDPEKIDDLLIRHPAQYWKLQQEFCDLQESTDITYVYVLQKYNGVWRFLLSSLYGRETPISTILEPHPEYENEEGEDRAWNEQTIVFHDYPDPTWGDLLICPRPVVKNGKTVILVCAAYKQDAVLRLHARIRNELIIAAAATVILSLLLWYKVYGAMCNLDRIVQERTQSLQEQMELAHAAYFAKTNFLASLSHELQTPLHAINGMAEIARNTVNDPAKTRKYLDNILTSGARLSDLFTNLLTTVQLECGKSLTSDQEFNFLEMLNRLSAQFFKMAKYKNQDFNTNIAPNVPMFVLGDEMQIRRCVLTLLDNAVKFTPERGEIAFAVEMISDKKNAVRIIVEDSGIGIAPEHQHRIFSLFEQGDPGASRRFQGTGLGLTMVKGLLNLMGGQITVKSDLGKGATFTMEMPLTPIGNETSLLAETSSLSDTHQIFHGKHILLVEDVENHRRAMLEILAPTGIEVDCAKVGDDAIEMFVDSSAKYDLILLDNFAPETGGVETVKRIRQSEDEHAEAIPIIAISDDKSPEIIAGYFNDGITDHLEKPFTDAALIAKIVHCLYERGDAKQVKIKN